MKKLLYMTLALLMLLPCLTSCNFTQNTSGALAGTAESTQKVEEMMTALAENRTDDAKALIHPEAVEKSDASIAQLERYLSDRTTSTIEQKTINISTSTGTPGISAAIR